MVAGAGRGHGPRPGRPAVLRDRRVRRRPHRPRDHDRRLRRPRGSSEPGRLRDRGEYQRLDRPRDLVDGRRVRGGADREEAAPAQHRARDARRAQRGAPLRVPDRGPRERGGPRGRTGDRRPHPRRPVLLHGVRDRDDRRDPPHPRVPVHPRRLPRVPRAGADRLHGAPVHHDGARDRGDPVGVRDVRGPHPSLALHRGFLWRPELRGAPMLGMDAEVEGLRTAVSRYFPVSRIVVNPFAVTFHVTADPATLDATFDGLRRELVPRNYVPSIDRDDSGYVVHVQKRPEPRFRGAHVNLLLLLATVGTTSVAGAVNWSSYANTPLLSAESFLFGVVSFTVPLLAILGAHEMGHYLMAKRHGVRASLPFFIPSVPILGTFGAFISMRDPIPNRKALLEIGLSGPLIGFAIALPITLIGLFLTATDPRPPSVAGGGELISPSILYGWMQSFFPQALTDPFRRHPTAFAGWVGLFVTAINLLPAGQLDGGHVARALFGDRHRYLSWGAVLFLLVLGVYYTGWFLFALIILLLGVRHPPPLNDLTKLSPSRQALGVLAIVILLITFVPAPFIEVPTQASFAFENSLHVPIDHLNATIARGNTTIILVNVNNTGNIAATVRTEIRPQNLDRIGWTLQILNFTIYGDGPPQTVAVTAPPAAITLNATEYATVRIRVGVPGTAAPGTYTFVVHGEIRDPARRAPLVQRDLSVNVTVT